MIQRIKIARTGPDSAITMKNKYAKGPKLAVAPFPYAMMNMIAVMMMVIAVSSLVIIPTWGFSL